MTGGYNYNNPGASNNWSTAGVPMRKILGGGGGGATIAGHGAMYAVLPGRGLQSGAQNAYAMMGYSGTLAKLYIETLTSQPGTGSLVYQSYVYANATATPGPVITVAAGGGAAIASSSASPIAFNPGDRIMVLINNNASTTSAGVGQVTMELDQTG